MSVQEDRPQVMKGSPANSEQHATPGAGWMHRTSHRLAGGLLVVVLASYSITWTRIVLPDGQAFPVQRLVALLFVASVGVLAAVRMARAIPRARHGSGRLVLASAVVAGLLLVWAVVATGAGGAAGEFQAGPALMDLSKYTVNVLTFLAVVYVVRIGLLSTKEIVRAATLSLALAVLLSLVPLMLYMLGFHFVDGIFLRTFGAAWGVWPSAGVIPRVVGPTAEPQQLSVAFCWSLLVVAQRRGAFSAVLTFLGVIVLLLSQSKFALLSIVVVALVVIMAFYGRPELTRRTRITVVAACGAGLCLVIAAAVALPTFQDTLRRGLQAEAFTERTQNASLLAKAAQEHPLWGIGPGQYGAFRSRELMIPLDNTYYPNNDYMKVLAELGVPGLVLLLLVVVLVCAAGASAVMLARRHGRSDSAALAGAALLATILILLNMVIGYELLHVFFWISAGLAVGLCARERALGTHPDVDQSRAAVVRADC